MNPLLVAAATNPDVMRSTANTIDKTSSLLTKVIGGILLCGAGYVAYRIVKKGISTASEKFSESVQNSALQNLKVNTNNTTLTTKEANVIANTWYGNMKDTGTSNEQEMINSILSYSADDLKLIAKEFGYRLYNVYGAPANKLLEKMSTSLNLYGWLSRELSGSDLAKITPKFREAGLC